jgi:hypothetical protein
VDFSGSPQSPDDIARHKAGEEGLCSRQRRLGKARPEGLQAAQIAGPEGRKIGEVEGCWEERSGSRPHWFGHQTCKCALPCIEGAALAL